MSTVLVHSLCNNNCIMCPAKWNVVKERRFTFSRICQEIKFKTNPQDPVIAITGGEPTLQKKLLKVLNFIFQNYPDKEIALLSNGRVFCYRDFTDLFKLYKFSKLKIVIPLHGHTNKLHDAITLSAGSFQQTVIGLKNLLLAGLTIELRIIVNKLNLKHLKDISEFILKALPGVSYVVFIAMDMEGRALENKRSVFVTYKEIKPEIRNSVKLLLKNNVNVRLFHFPLCTIERQFWRLACNSVEPYELTYLPACNQCLEKKNCMGILKTYLRHRHASEFKPFKSHTSH